MLDEAVPGSIRRAEHFTAFLARFVEYLKTRMRVLHVVAETPLSFLQHLKDITFIERKPLKFVSLWFSCASTYSSPRFCSERLASLVRTLELTRIDEYSSLQKVAAFATLVATYDKGMSNLLIRLMLTHFDRIPTHSGTIRNRKCDSTESSFPFSLFGRFFSYQASFRSILFSSHHFWNTVTAGYVSKNVSFWSDCVRILCDDFD